MLRSIVSNKELQTGRYLLMRLDRAIYCSVDYQIWRLHCLIQITNGSVLARNWPLFTQLAASTCKICCRVSNGLLSFASAWRINGSKVKSTWSRDIKCLGRVRKKMKAGPSTKCRKTEKSICSTNGRSKNIGIIYPNTILWPMELIFMFFKLYSTYVFK